MVLVIKTKVMQSPTSYTQYITIPSAMVRDSQYPFKPNQEVELVVIPHEGKLEIRLLEKKAENRMPKEVRV